MTCTGCGRWNNIGPEKPVDGKELANSDDIMRCLGLQTGGAMSLYKSSAILTSCIIIGNTVGRVRQCVLAADCAQRGAGMLRCCCLQAGGGIQLQRKSSVTLTSCTLSSNRASVDSGGAMHTGDSSATLTMYTIINNSAGRVRPQALQSDCVQ